MQKLYKKGQVHPSPPHISDHLAFLPATLLTLAAALSPQDREVLAYLISSSSSSAITTGKKKKSFNGAVEHPPLFHCDCFRCYTSYWVRWDASPNRRLIHDIIDAFEDELTQQKNKMKSHKRDRKNKRGGHGHDVELNGFSKEDESMGVEKTESELVAASPGSGDDGEEFEKGAVRKLVSFIGETIWGVWN